MTATDDIACRLLDILPDGRAERAELNSPAPETGYRWTHWQLDDPELAPWLERHLPPLAVQALTQSETRPRCLRLGGGIVVTLRGINLNPGEESDDMVSVRGWFTPTFVVTVRVRRVFVLDDLRQEVEAGAAPNSPFAFFATLAARMVQRIEGVSLALEDKVDALEERLFDGDSNTDPNSGDLARLRRSAIRLRRYVGPQAIAVMEAGREIGRMGHTSLSAEIGETANRATRTVEELDAARDRLAALADHVDMRQASQQHRNGYILSIVAAIFLPLGFLTGLFGVNIAGMPGMAWPGAFWVLVAASLILGGALALIFRAMRWF